MKTPTLSTSNWYEVVEMPDPVHGVVYCACVGTGEFLCASTDFIPPLLHDGKYAGCVFLTRADAEVAIAKYLLGSQ